MGKLIDIAEFFRGRAPVRPDFASTHLEIGLSKEDELDEPSEIDLVGIDTDHVGRTIGIQYVDAKSDVTQRWVSIDGFHQNKNGHWYMRCYCFMRESRRSFLLERVMAVFDEHGEFAEASEFFGVSELEFVIPVVGTGKPGSAHKAVARDGIRVLTALARADGHLHENELEIIIGYAEEEGLYRDIVLEEEDRIALSGYISRQQPTGVIVAQCLDRLMERGEDDLINLHRFIKKVIDADDRIDPAEFDFVISVRDHLRR